MKRLCAALVTILVISIYVPTYANAANRVDTVCQPMYLYTSDIRARLTINNSGNAACTGKIYTWSTNSSIAMTVTLYRQMNASWIKVHEWSDSATGINYFSISENHSVCIGTYKVIVTGTVTIPGIGAEDVSSSSIVVIYN